MDLVGQMRPETCGGIETTCWAAFRGASYKCYKWDRQFPIHPSHHTWTYLNKHTCTQHRKFLFSCHWTTESLEASKADLGLVPKHWAPFLPKRAASLPRDAYEDAFAEVERGSHRQAAGSTKESILYQKHFLPEETFLGTWHLTCFLQVSVENVESSCFWTAMITHIPSTCWFPWFLLSLFPLFLEYLPQCLKEDTHK